MALSSPSTLANYTSTSDDASLNTAATSFTPANNSLVIAIVTGVNFIGSMSPASWTLSGGGYTWTNQTSLAKAAGTGPWNAIAVFTAQVTTGVSTTLSFSVNGTTNFSLGGGMYVCGHTGYNTSTPLTNFVTTNNTTAGALTLTLPSTPASTSNVISVDSYSASNNQNVPTVGSGWNLLYSQNIKNGWDMVAGEWLTSFTSTTVPWANQCSPDTVGGNAACQIAFEVQAAASGPATPTDCSFLFQPSENLKHPATLDTNQPLNDTFAGWTAAKATPTQLGFWFQPPFLGPTPKSTQNTNQPFDISPKEPKTPTAFWLRPLVDPQRHIPTIYTAQSFVCNPTIGPPIPGWYTQAPDLLNHPHSLDTNQPKDNFYTGWTNNTPSTLGFWQQPNDLLRHPITVDTNQRIGAFTAPTNATPADCSFLFQSNALLNHFPALDTNQHYVPIPLVTVFITSTSTWTVPQNVHSITIEGIGGGQAGFNSTTNNGGNGGDAADYSRVTLAVAPGQVLYINIGAAGSSNGSNGGDTWVNLGTNSPPVSSSTGILAAGGNSGSTSIGANVNTGGGPGSGGSGNPSYGGGGGGAGGPLGAGTVGSNASGSQGGNGGAANSNTVAGGTGTSSVGNPGNSGISWTQTSDNSTAGSGSGGGGG